MSHLPTPLLAGLLNLTDIQYPFQGRKPIFPSPFLRPRSFLGLHSRNTQAPLQPCRKHTCLLEVLSSPPRLRAQLFSSSQFRGRAFPFLGSRVLSFVFPEDQSRPQAFSEALEREDVRSGWGNAESTAWEVSFSTFSLFQPCPLPPHLSESAGQQRRT